LIVRQQRCGRQSWPVRCLVPEPRQLTLGIAPGGELGRRDAILKTDPAVKNIEQRRHANRLHDRQRAVDAAGVQCRNFCHGAGCHHGIETTVTSADQRIAANVDDAGTQGDVAGYAALCFLLIGSKRPSCAAHDLEGACQPLRIPGP